MINVSNEGFLFSFEKTHWFTYFQIAGKYQKYAKTNTLNIILDVFSI